MLAYLITRDKSVIYRCEGHPIENKKKAWGKEYRQCKKLTLEQAVIFEVMTA